jgi:hypothetical protein
MRCCAGAASALVVTILLASPVRASIITIDDLSAIDTPSPWSIVLTAASMSTVSEGPSIPGVLGGVRTSSVVGQSFGVPGLDNVSVGIAPDPAGRLVMTTSGAADGLLKLLYDGAGGGLSADFSASSGIRIDFPLFDWAGGVDMPVSVSLDDGVNTIMLERTLTSPGMQSVFFPFADFSGIGGFNLSNIDSTEVTFDPQAAQDFHVDLIETFNVPEPMSLALAGVGCALLAILVWREKGRNNAAAKSK